MVTAPHPSVAVIEAAASSSRSRIRVRIESRKGDEAWTVMAPGYPAPARPRPRAFRASPGRARRRGFAASSARSFSSVVTVGPAVHRLEVLLLTDPAVGAAPVGVDLV